MLQPLSTLSTKLKLSTRCVCACPTRAGTIAFLPVLFAIALIYSVVAYFMVGLAGGFSPFFTFVAGSFLTLAVANSYVLFIGGFVPNFAIGVTLSTAVMAFFFLCSGFFIARCGTGTTLRSPRLCSGSTACTPLPSPTPPFPGGTLPNARLHLCALPSDQCTSLPCHSVTPMFSLCCCMTPSLSVWCCVIVFPAAHASLSTGSG